MKWKRAKIAMRLCAIPAAWLALIGLGVVVGVRVPCVLYLFTGIQCPGCGLTRAAESLLRGNYFEALGYNLLIIPLTFALIIVMVDTCRFIWTGRNWLQKFTSTHSLALMALLLVYMAARNIF